MIYNTATINDVIPGFYYWDGTKWVKFNTGTATSNDWSITGNAGTNPATNFIGTTDNNHIAIRTNNVEKIRVQTNGNVGIGTTSPAGPLEVMALTTVIEATGGTITHSGGYTIHTFTSSGTFTMNTASTSVEYLVVGGGGSGGYSSAAWGHCGGGGGAGRFREGTLAVTAQAYSVTIGNGGSNGSDGGNSIFSTITSEGGGSGADAGGDGIGANGGSGGGGTLGTSGAGGVSSFGAFGNNGGANGLTPAGGGGGGSGAVGQAGWGVSTGVGGPGTVSSISGSPVTYAGGGGGGYGQPNNNGGTGGGGRGGIISNDPGMAGTANSGGGGGGAYIPGSGTLSGAAGGSGIVIIRYLTPANNVLGSAFLVDSTGNVGIGTTSPSSALHVVGNICYTGSIGACSDIRYKQNVAPLSNSLSNVLKLQGVNYFWRAAEFPQNKFNKEKQIGFIAQDIEKTYPEMVLTDEKGYKSVDYSRLTPVLVEAIKEQQKQIEALQKLSLQLKDTVEAQQKQIEEKK